MNKLLRVPVGCSVLATIAIAAISTGCGSETPMTTAKAETENIGTVSNKLQASGGFELLLG